MSRVWLFGGHGAHYVGMGRTILRDTVPGRAWLAEAERVTGLPLGRIAAQGPARALTDPMVLEPLLAVVSGAYADLLRAEEGPPGAVGAYSAGHVGALYAAGCIDRAGALAIAHIRGVELAHAAAQMQGGMVAVHGLPEDRLVLLAEDDPVEPASIAARNAPQHVVFSGSAAALARAAARASHAGAVTAPLDVAGAWHSPWLQGASIAIASAAAQIACAPARLPVWSSVTAAASTDPQRLRSALAASVVCPVEWAATVEAMLASGADSFVEVSPGRSLWGLLAQIEPPHAFTRRYVECQRGPARHRPAGVVPARGAHPPVQPVSFLQRAQSPA